MAGSAKKRAVPNLFAMTSDDREKIGARNRPDLKKARQLHLSDLLRGPFDIKSVALTGLFILAVFYTMYFMRAMLLPLVLALLLSYLLAPVVRLLGRLRVNAPLGAAIVLLSLVGLLIYGTSRLAGNDARPADPGGVLCLHGRHHPVRDPAPGGGYP